MSNFTKFMEYYEKLVKEHPEELKPDCMQPDGDGLELPHKVVDGLHFPCLPGLHKNMSELPHLGIREDDVVIGSFPKSGSNWLWEVCSMILKESAAPVNSMKTDGFLELLPAWLLDGYGSPRVLNTHLLPDRLPDQACEKKTKLILMLRNPKDVVVSYYNHVKSIPYMYNYSKGTFKGYFEVFVTEKNDYGSWFDYALVWDKFLQTYPNDRQLIVYYEDLKEDLPKNIRLIAKYLDVDLDDAIVDAIADGCGFKAMQQAKHDLQTQNMPSGRPNSGSKLPELFRKGVVGDWKNYFTVAQSERLDAVYKAKMGKCLFNFRYEL